MEYHFIQDRCVSLESSEELNCDPSLKIIHVVENRTCDSPMVWIPSLLAPTQSYVALSLEVERIGGVENRILLVDHSNWKYS